MSAVGQHQVLPYPNPVPGVSASMLPVFVRGNDNTTATSYNAHDADAGIHLVTTTTASVSTATAITAAVTNNTVTMVSGDDGSGKVFIELVGWNGTAGTAGTPTVLYTSGTPAARTYSVASSILKVAMGSGTYTITTLPFVFTT